MGIVIKLIKTGSHLAIDAIQAARARSQAKEAQSNPYDPEYTFGLADQRGQYVLADEETSQRLIREGRAEIPASNEFHIHQKYAELPTYEESERAPTAFSGTQQPIHDQPPRADSFSAAPVDLVDQLVRLPCPVVIPSCRDSSSERQFERTYAPVLANCGISQETFCMFLDEFELALRVSK